jgi:hypothetical protein
MVKSTYGTGCFALANTGDKASRVDAQIADDRRLPVQGQGTIMRSKARSSRRAPRSAARRPRHSRGAPEAGDWRPADLASRHLVPATGLGAIALG